MSTTTKPKLAEMTPSERRIAAAELLGLSNVQAGPWYAYKADGNVENHVGNPDEDANDALALIEHMRAKGLRFNSVCHRETGTWTAWFEEDEEIGWSATAPTFGRAITSAALLAAGVAE